MYKISIKPISLIVVAILACSCSVTQANGFSLSAGTNFTSGNYGGTTSTDIWYVPFTARYRTNRSLFRLTVPYISITGPGNVIGSGINGTAESVTGYAGGGTGVSDVVNGAGFLLGPIGLTDVDSSNGITDANTIKFERRTQSGLGDIIAAFTYNLIYHKTSRTTLGITGRIKIPTASTSRRLGSGHVDYAIQSDLMKSISNFGLRATFGYRILGNPSSVNFRNVFYGGAGAGYRISSKSGVGTSFNIGQSAVHLQDSRTLSIYYSHRISNDLRLSTYGLKGLSDRSPDWGSGITLRYLF